MTSDRREVAPELGRPDTQVARHNGIGMPDEPVSPGANSAAGMQRIDIDCPDIGQGGAGLRGLVASGLEASAATVREEDHKGLIVEEEQEPGLATLEPEYHNFIPPVGNDPEEVFERCCATPEIGVLFSLLKNRYHPPIGHDKFDLNQVMLIGLFKAVKGNRGDKGPFYSFVKLCVESELKTWITSGNRSKHSPLNKSLRFSSIDHESADGVDDLSPEDGRPQTEDLIIAREGVLAIIDLFRTAQLSGIEAGCLKDFIFGFSYAEIADKYGIELKAVDNAINRARRKMKNTRSARELGC